MVNVLSQVLTGWLLIVNKAPFEDLSKKLGRRDMHGTNRSTDSIAPLNGMCCAFPSYLTHSIYQLLPINLAYLDAEKIGRHEETPII